MGSALFCRENAVLPFLGATDLTDKEGYLVTLAGETATLSASATVRAPGIILEGRPAAKKSSIGILGTIPGTVRMKTSGDITKGAFVQQAADGTVVTDAAAGARTIVGVALETGVSGDKIEVAPCTPLSLT